MILRTLGDHKGFILLPEFTQFFSPIIKRTVRYYRKSKPDVKVSDLSLGDGRVLLQLVHTLFQSFQSGDYPLLKGAALGPATITCNRGMCIMIQS